jgi:hypothetical protein
MSRPSRQLQNLQRKIALKESRLQTTPQTEQGTSAKPGKAGAKLKQWRKDAASHGAKA